MVATIDQVRASNPAALVAAGAGARSSESAAERSVSDGQSITTRLGDGWQGDASDAANRQAQGNIAALQRLENMYERLGSVLTAGGGQLSSMRSGIVGKVDRLTLMGWQVASDGTVSIKPGGVIDNWSRISPVVAVTAQLMAMGAALALLREERILLIGSGSITHNLAELDWRGDGAATPDWALAFRQWMVHHLNLHDLNALQRWQALAPHAQRNHPTDEHLRPLFFACGAGRRFSLVHSSFEMGALGMDLYRFD